MKFSSSRSGASTPLSVHLSHNGNKLMNNVRNVCCSATIKFTCGQLFGMCIMIIFITAKVSRNGGADMGIDMDAYDISRMVTSSTDGAGGGNQPEGLVADDLLLSVPFYIYEDLMWSNATILGEEYLDGKKDFGECEDIWFLKWALKHPLRTHDPSKAKLFIMPLLLNGVDDSYNHPDNNKAFCATLGTGKDAKHLCRKELIEQTNEVIVHSSIFQQYGNKYPERHIIVQSHWVAQYRQYKYDTSFQIPPKMNWYIERMNSIVFERGNVWYDKYGKQPNVDYRLRFPHTYVGEACPGSNKFTSDVSTLKYKKTDIAFVGSMYTRSEEDSMKSPETEKHFEDRRKACNLLLEYQKNYNVLEYQRKSNLKKGSSNKFFNNETLPQINIDVCGRGSVCPAIMDAKLGLHHRGDSMSSQRPMNLILSGTVPIFTRKEQYDILPSWIDWKKITYFVDMEPHNKQRTERAIRQDLLAVIKESQKKGGTGSTYETKYKLMMENQKLFDWRNEIYPFDVYMYMLQAYLYPETRKYSKHSKFSLLILPEVNSESFVLYRTYGNDVMSTNADRSAWYA